MDDLSDTQPEKLLEQVQSGRLRLRLHEKEEGETSGSDRGGVDEVLWSSICTQPLSINQSNTPLGDLDSCIDPLKGPARFDAYNDPDLTQPLVVTIEPERYCTFLRACGMKYCMVVLTMLMRKKAVMAAMRL